MARRKRRDGQALHRVLGVGALFSTAYGNVGSSIYYALGVVAAAALGLTPLSVMLGAIQVEDMLGIEVDLSARRVP